MLLGAYTGAALVTVFGVIHPVYRSFKSLQGPAGSEEWLPYWLLFALFSSVEFLLDLVFAMWFPLWYELKLGFVLALQPTFMNLAHKLYYERLEPVLADKAPLIDRHFAELADKLKNINLDDIPRLVTSMQSSISCMTSGTCASKPAAAADDDDEPCAAAPSASMESESTVPDADLNGRLGDEAIDLTESDESAEVVDAAEGTGGAESKKEQ